MSHQLPALFVTIEELVRISHVHFHVALALRDDVQTEMMLNMLPGLIGFEDDDGDKPIFKVTDIIDEQASVCGQIRRIDAQQALEEFRKAIDDFASEGFAEWTKREADEFTLGPNIYLLAEQMLTSDQA